MDDTYTELLNILTKERDVVFENKTGPMQWYAGRTLDGEFFLNINTLNEIGKKYDCDKSDRYHSYLRKYEFFLSKFKNEHITLLELGVLNGSSLKMWSEFFSGSRIIGTDINKECLKHNGGNIEVLISDISSVKDLTELKAFNPHVIIEDATHFWSHQILALVILFDSIKEGGIYIMEDSDTAFGDYKNMEYGDAIISGHSFCSLISEILSGNNEIDNSIPEVLYSYAKEIANKSDMVAFIKGSVIIVKK